VLNQRYSYYITWCQIRQETCAESEVQLLHNVVPTTSSNLYCARDGHILGTVMPTLEQVTFKILFLSFRLVLNVIYSFLGNSPASEF